MNKYYTPKIEEFHIGFEYEIRDPMKIDFNKVFACKKDFLGNKIPCDIFKYRVMHIGWEKRTFDLNSISLDKNLQYIEENNILTPKLLNYRVKYLDREDIESFGFVFEGGKLIKNRGDNYKHKEYSLYHRSIDNRIIIGKYGDCIFLGDIKNKSELKKLLKQLKITE